MEQITFGKDNLPGFIAGDVDNPALLVIQEWWGVNEVVKGHALKLASQGYRCLVPDIYHGKIGIEKEEAHHLFSNLDWPRAVAEITEAVEYLKSNGAKKVGAIGFCMGGALSLAAAQHSGIQCAQSFYGLPSPQLSQPDQIKVPCSLHVGELDTYVGFSDPEAMTAFTDKINNAGGTAEIHVYKECGHAFLNEGPLGEHNRNIMEFPHPPHEQQELAWERVSAFFEKNLKEN